MDNRGSCSLINRISREQKYNESQATLQNETENWLTNYNELLKELEAGKLDSQTLSIKIKQLVSDSEKLIQSYQNIKSDFAKLDNERNIFLGVAIGVGAVALVEGIIIVIGGCQFFCVNGSFHRGTRPPKYTAN